MLGRLRNLLRSDRGAVALETIISVPVMIAVTIMFWAVMIVIYNQATMNYATQAAAQGALTVFDRQTYRDGQTSGYISSSGTPTTRAAAAARSIFEENSRAMLTEQIGKASATARVTDVRILCGPNVDTPDNLSPCGDVGAPLERVQVNATAESGYWLMGVVYDRDPKQRGEAGMTSTGDAVSVAPTP